MTKTQADFFIVWNCYHLLLTAVEMYVFVEADWTTNEYPLRQSSVPCVFVSSGVGRECG